MFCAVLAVGVSGIFIVERVKTYIMSRKLRGHRIN